MTVCKTEKGKYCLDFVLREGEKEAFDQHYQELVDDTEKLWPYNNAWIEEKQEKKQWKRNNLQEIYNIFYQNTNFKN